jgi:hypothetical protein
VSGPHRSERATSPETPAPRAGPIIISPNRPRRDDSGHTHRRRPRRRRGPTLNMADGHPFEGTASLRRTHREPATGKARGSTSSAVSTSQTACHSGAETLAAEVEATTDPPSTTSQPSCSQFDGVSGQQVDASSSCPASHTPCRFQHAMLRRHQPGRPARGARRCGGIGSPPTAKARGRRLSNSGSPRAFRRHATNP